MPLKQTRRAKAEPKKSTNDDQMQTQRELSAGQVTVVMARWLTSPNTNGLLCKRFINQVLQIIFANTPS